MKFYVKKISSKKKKNKALSLLIQRLDDLAKDSLDMAYTKDGDDESPLVVVVDQRLRLGVIGLKPLLDCGFGVVCPLVGSAAQASHFPSTLGLLNCMW
jgi:hypothetical protein